MIRFYLIAIGFFSILTGTSMADPVNQKSAAKRNIIKLEGSPSLKLKEGVRLSAEEAASEAAKSRFKSRMIANTGQPIPE